MMGNTRLDDMHMAQHLQLRTAAMLLPVADPRTIDTRLKERGFVDVGGPDRWVKLIKTDAALLCIEVRHNEDAPVFHTVEPHPTRRIRLAWFAFVEASGTEAEQLSDRTRHVRALEEECMDLFSIRSYNFGYRPASS